MKYSYTGSICWRGKDETRTENGDDVFSGFYVSRSGKDKKVSERSMARRHLGNIQG